MLCVVFGSAGCASLSTPPLVHPARVGSDLSLEAILEDLEAYAAYFSARSFNPSGLFFVPRDSPYTVIPEKRGLGQGWNPVQEKADIEKMIAIIKERDRLEHPALKALIRPLSGNVEPQPGDVLGYLFSSRSTFARLVDADPDVYKVFQINEIPRMGERDEEGFLWRGGFRR
jgi:hypothetical protein